MMQLAYFLVLFWLMLETAAASVSYTISAGNVWDGRKFSEQTVVILDGQFAANVSPTAPDSATVTLSDAYYLIPGLIDAHVHLVETGLPKAGENDASYASIRRHAAAHFYSGVTSARTHLIPTEPGTRIKRASQSACFPAPRLQIGGPGFIGNVPELDAAQVWGSRDTAQISKRISELADQGIDWLALHGAEAIPEDIYQLIINSSKKHNLRLMVQGDNRSRVSLALESGAPTLEYIVGSSAYSEDQLAALGRSGAPAMVVPIGYYLQSARALQSPSPFAYLGVNAHMQRDRIGEQQSGIVASDFDSWFRGLDYIQEYASQIAIIRNNFKALQESGANLILGTDVGSPGNFHERAIWTELAAWLSLHVPVETALAAATYRSAIALDMPDRGRIEPGYDADFVILSAPPSSESSAKDVVAVIKSGVIHGNQAAIPEELKQYTAQSLCKEADLRLPM